VATLVLMCRALSFAQTPVTEFPIPSPNSQPAVIAGGPDGNLWSTESLANKIGRITPDLEFAVPTANAGLKEIAGGADGNLWFCEFQAIKIGRVTPAGVITEFPLPPLAPSPDPGSPGVPSRPFGITAGPDGNVWYTRPCRRKHAAGQHGLAECRQLDPMRASVWIACTMKDEVSACAGQEGRTTS